MQTKSKSSTNDDHFVLPPAQQPSNIQAKHIKHQKIEKQKNLKLNPIRIELITRTLDKPTPRNTTANHQRSKTVAKSQYQFVFNQQNNQSQNACDGSSDQMTMQLPVYRNAQQYQELRKLASKQGITIAGKTLDPVKILNQKIIINTASENSGLEYDKYGSVKNFEEQTTSRIPINIGSEQFTPGQLKDKQKLKQTSIKLNNLKLSSKNSFNNSFIQQTYNHKICDSKLKNIKTPEVVPFIQRIEEPTSQFKYEYNSQITSETNDGKVAGADHQFSNKFQNSNTDVTDGGQNPQSIMTSAQCSKAVLGSDYNHLNIRDRLGTSYQGLANRTFKVRNLTTRAKTPIIFPVTDAIPYEQNVNKAENSNQACDDVTNKSSLFDKVQSILKTSGNPEVMKLQRKKRNKLQAPSQIDLNEQVKMPFSTLTPIHQESSSIWQQLTLDKQTQNFRRQINQKHIQKKIKATCMNESEILPIIVAKGQLLKSKNDAESGNFTTGICDISNDEMNRSRNQQLTVFKDGIKSIEFKKKQYIDIHNQQIKVVGAQINKDSQMDKVKDFIKKQNTIAQFTSHLNGYATEINSFVQSQKTFGSGQSPEAKMQPQFLNENSKHNVIKLNQNMLVIDQNAIESPERTQTERMNLLKQQSSRDSAATGRSSGLTHVDQDIKSEKQVQNDLSHDQYQLMNNHSPDFKYQSMNVTEYMQSPQVANTPQEQQTLDNNEQDSKENENSQTLVSQTALTPMDYQLIQSGLKLGLSPRTSRIKKTKDQEVQHNQDLQDLKSIGESATNSKHQIDIQQLEKTWQMTLVSFDQKNKPNQSFMSNDYRYKNSFNQVQRIKTQKVKDSQKTSRTSSCKPDRVSLKGFNFPMEFFNDNKVKIKKLSPIVNRTDVQKQEKTYSDQSKKKSPVEVDGINHLIKSELESNNNPNQEFLKKLTINLSQQRQTKEADQLKFLPEDMHDLVKNWKRSQQLSQFYSKNYPSCIRQNLSTAGQIDIKYQKIKKKMFNSPQTLGTILGNDFIPCYEPKVNRNSKYYKENLSLIGYQKVPQIDEQEYVSVPIKNEQDLQAYNEKRNGQNRYKNIASQQYHQQKDTSYFVTSIYPRIVKECELKQAENSGTISILNMNGRQSPVTAQTLKESQMMAQSLIDQKKNKIEIALESNTSREVSPKQNKLKLTNSKEILSGMRSQTPIGLYTQYQTEQNSTPRDAINQSIDQMRSFQKQVAINQHQLNYDRIRADCSQKFMNKLNEQESLGWPTKNRSPEKLGGQGKVFPSDYKQKKKKNLDALKMQNKLNNALKNIMAISIGDKRKQNAWDTLKNMQEEKMMKAQIEEKRANEFCNPEKLDQLIVPAREKKPRKTEDLLKRLLPGHDELANYLCKIMDIEWRSRIKRDVNSFQNQQSPYHFNKYDLYDNPPLHKDIVNEIILICRDLADSEQYGDLLCRNIENQLALVPAELCIQIHDMLKVMLKYEMYTKFKNQLNENDHSSLKTSEIEDESNENSEVNGASSSPRRRGMPNYDDFNTFMSISSASSLRRAERNRNAAAKEFEAPFKLKLAIVRDLVDNQSIMFDEMPQKRKKKGFIHDSASDDEPTNTFKDLKITVQDSSERVKMHHLIMKRQRINKMEKQERKILIKKEVVYLTQMYSLKEVLREVFKPRIQNQSQVALQKKLSQLTDQSQEFQRPVQQFNINDALERVNHDLPYGTFTNTCALEMLKKIHLPIGEIISDFLPQKNKQIPLLEDLFCKYMLKNDILRSEERGLIQNGKNLLHNQNQKNISITRIAPTIRHNGTLFLNEKLIDDEYKGNIEDFIIQFRQLPGATRKCIKKVIIDGTKIHEQQIIEMLQTCVKPLKQQQDQMKQYSTKQNIQSHLASLVHQVIGTDSWSGIKYLCLGNICLTDVFVNYICNNLLQELFSLELFNITCKAKKHQWNFMDGLSEYIQEHEGEDCKLMRVKLSKMNLSNHSKELAQLIDHCFNSLIDLDLSFCNLTVTNVKDIIEVLQSRGEDDAMSYNEGIIKGTLRAINLSYNPLYALPPEGGVIHKQNNFNASESSFSDQDDDPYNTFSFGKKLTHIDLSGIEGISSKELLSILQEISKEEKCPNLLAVHLNDLGINQDALLTDDVEMLFNMVNENVNEKTDLFKAIIKYLKKVRGVNYVSKKADSFKYVDVIQEALNHRKPTSSHKFDRNLLMAMHMQMVQEQKQMKNAGFLSSSLGIGNSHHKGTSLDHYVINRGWNMPELIFNQNPSQDNNN